MATKRGCRRVKRRDAQHKSGAKKGRLKPGCRYLKGDGAQCCPPGSKKGSTSKRGKRSSTKSKTKGRKATGAASRARKGQAPNTPNMNRLNEIRRYWKSAASCQDKKAALRALKKQFQVMGSKPGSKKRGESDASASTRRFSRFKSEYQNKLEMTEAFCSGRSRTRGSRGDQMAVEGLKGFKGHPCASPNPPRWCNKK